MGRFRRSTGANTAILFGLLFAMAAARAVAQPPGDDGKTHKSVYGTLERVDPSLNGIFMKEGSGKRMAWQVPPAVIEEAKAFKPGTPLIVIYRQMDPSQKKVTAVAFPGTASSPIYVNTTGSSVVIRSGPMVGGVCGPPSDAPINESRIPRGGRAEVLEACWCCASPGETCTPGNKSGQGTALLVSCFQ